MMCASYLRFDGNRAEPVWFYYIRRYVNEALDRGASRSQCPISKNEK